MTRHGIRSWLAGALVACSALVGAPGCAEFTAVAKFLRYRLEDFAEMADVGITITTTPQWGFYWNSLDLFPVGYSKIDGWFVGIGGGYIGVARHYNECYGFGIGIEKIGWSGDLFSPVPEENMHKRLSGVLGMAVALTGLTDYGSGPNYSPACVHFFPHIGYVGAVWNLRYTEIVDFALGWFGLDISGDDGRQVGYWNIPGITRPWNDPGDAPPEKHDGLLSATLAFIVRQFKDDDRPAAPEPAEKKAAPAAAAGTEKPRRPRSSVLDRPLPRFLRASPGAGKEEKRPPAAARKPASPRPRIYVVRKGDIGLMQIAREQLGDVRQWRAIVELNGLAPPYQVRPGQKLLLPDSGAANFR